MSQQEAVPAGFDGQSVLGEEDRALVEGVLAHALRPLAKAITLIESSRPDHQRRDGGKCKTEHHNIPLGLRPVLSKMPRKQHHKASR